MNKAVEALLLRLSYGDEGNTKREKTTSYGVVGALARVYEKARNAMEYRADHLVRRAAIERILKRIVFFDKNPDSLSEHLLTELRWAKYLSPEELKKTNKQKLKEVLTKYTQALNNSVPGEWVIKVASAEIEETYNLNVDYHQFTFFAFQYLKQQIEIVDEDIDLLLYYSIDKIYAGSDDEQIAYHMLKLAGPKSGQKELEETWRLFNLAKGHRLTPKINKFVRRQSPPLTLIRDIYFYNPKEFKKTVSTEEGYKQEAGEALDIQLTQMSQRISTATWRSIIYVFLTKMLLVIALEIPFEILIYKNLAKVPLAINVIFPPLIMWLSTLQIKIPNQDEKEDLINESWSVIKNFLFTKEEGEAPGRIQKQTLGTVYWIFSTLYTIIFLGVFGLIFFTLDKIGFTFASRVIFVFFLSIIAFFAYRISQIRKVYLWKRGKESSSLVDMFSLPIITIGSKLSQGLAKLNFLAFAFDFILEAPFKIILQFIDSWIQFLSIKKEEEIIE